MISKQVIARVLNRKPRELTQLSKVNIKNHTIVITGAGGFIGSHLCHELIKYEPERLILIENNEFALYEIHRKLEDNGVEVIPILASCGDEKVLHAIGNTWNIDTVYHVAAYKHVPLVERNPIAAIQNNVFEAESLFRMLPNSELIVISSDKAVNPTSVMGATKRLVENVAFARQSLRKVKVVRFGNVLWSTGSVLPLFAEQLMEGKRVTITHEEVDRYFMSIEEAINLILEVQMLDTGTYVFNMGKPVRIIDIARRLAKEMKLPFKVRFVGLRPGEKMHEELTLGENLKGTLHPDIMEAQEERPRMMQVIRTLNLLTECVETYDVGALRYIMQKAIPDYNPMCGIVDDIFLHKNVKNAFKLMDDCFEVPKVALEK